MNQNAWQFASDQLSRQVGNASKVIHEPIERARQALGQQGAELT